MSKKYRIAISYIDGQKFYQPEVKVLLWWRPIIVDENWAGATYIAESESKAMDAIDRHKKGSNVSYKYIN